MSEGRMRKHECGRATNARGECPKDECCRATNVQARMSVTIAVGECETIVVMPRQKCLKTLLNEPFSVSRKLL